MSKVSKKSMPSQMKDAEAKQSSPGRGWSALSLCLAKIVEIHWEEMRCTLEITQGQGDDDRALTGVELLMPSMGNRHFMGGIPEIGDQCVVGWFANNTRQGTSGKTPAILAWWPSVPWVRHDWHMTQGFEPDEDIMETNRNRKIIQNFYQRIRHKMRHYSPGNIGASSSQGSDMLLDESVHLSNRRSNEIIIRDQDQAIVMRSLQQFHALSGARVYGGMVQRDARSLPKEMFSDGIKWDSEIQIDKTGKPYNPFKAHNVEEFQNPVDEGRLTPHPVFERQGYTEVGVNVEGERTNFEGELPLSIDPYVFLYNAGLIDEEGYENVNGDGVIYGGKSILRIGTTFDENAVEVGEAFTEYRIEMNHTTDGTLPVTEQTDGFDSDRLSTTNGETKNPPFIEWVLGTPVGNDPFSESGQETYGIPVVPSVSNGLGVATETTPFSDHAATLLRISPLVPGLDDSFVSFTKGGKFKARVSSTDDNALEANIRGGAFISTDKDLNISSDNTNITSDSDTTVSTGTLRLEATGSKAGEQLSGDEPNVSVVIKGNKRVSIQSDSAIAFVAPVVDFSQAGQIRLASASQMEFNTGAGMNMSANTIKQSSMGQYEQICGGPVDGLPIAGPARKVTVTEAPFSGGAGTPSDSYTNLFGGRSEVYIGPATNTRLMASATETTTIAAGAKTDVIGGTTTITDPSGHKFLAPAGAMVATSGTVISLSATSVSIRGNTSVLITGPSVTIGAPGGAVGPIVCGSDIHPILGVPFASFCLPRGQNLASTV